MLSFGQYIRKLRLKKGDTLQKLAAYLDIAPALLTQIERGQVNATKEQVFQWASYFNVSVKEMLILYQSSRIHSETKDGQSRIEGLARAHSCLMNNRVAASRRYKNMKEELSQLHHSQIEVKLHKPSSPLNAYIESILYCKGHHLAYPFEKILPDGVVQLIIALNDQERQLMAAKGPNISLKKAWIAGVQKQYLSYQLQQSEAILYIRFRPGALYALSGIPQSAIENTVVEADLLLGPSILHLREELLHATTIAEVFQKIEHYFSTKMKQQGVEQAVIRYMHTHIHRPLSFLVQKTGYTQKHLIHLFKKYVGVTPKYLQRISRFNSALNQMHSITDAVDWSSIAFDNHYYDQAHFIKEFNHFSGVSPQAYLESGSTCAKVMHTHSGW